MRDPDRPFACLRCGAPVVYKGRGRRPVWCSTNCRVQASIERKGNRLAGVQPQIVKVVPPKQKLTAWEEQERRRITSEVTQDSVVAFLAARPSLLGDVLWRIRRNPQPLPEARAERLGAELRATADAISDPPTRELPQPLHRNKRDAAEWATLLEELATELGNGQFYTRDLPTLDDPLHRVVERFVRRNGEHGR